MTPDLATRLLDIYGRATEAAARDDLAIAGTLIAEAGDLLSGPMPEAPTDPAARAAIAGLATACAEARTACVDAVLAARERLHQRAAAELRSGAVAGRYIDRGTPDARFIDRRS